jgi:hypothetical protein
MRNAAEGRMGGPGQKSLVERVEELIGLHKGPEPLRVTMGTQAAIGELIALTEGLEKAILEIALEVQKRPGAHA